MRSSNTIRDGVTKSDAAAFATLGNIKAKREMNRHKLLPRGWLILLERKRVRFIVVDSLLVV